MNAPTQPWLNAGSARPEEEDADERLTRSGAPEMRGNDSVRQDAERMEIANLSDAEIEQLIRSQYEDTALATPPDMPGFHLCWLTTTSQYDTIQKRMRVGYSPVLRSDLPGFDPSNGKDLAGYEGLITCNEMALFKLPLRSYQVMMNLFHHKKPLDTESTIIQQIKDGGARSEAESDAPDGISTMERSVKAAARINPAFD